MSEAAQTKTELPPYGRPWLEIYADFRKPIPAHMLEEREQAGQILTYVSWYNRAKILHRYAPGWSKVIGWISRTEDEVSISGGILIPAAEGIIRFEATATEPLWEYRKPRSGQEPNTSDGLVRVRAVGYGSALDRAEASLLTRASSLAGIGIDLYDKKLR